MDKTNDTLEIFLKNSGRLARRIEARSPDIIRLLTQYETHDAAEDEISRSIEALQNVNDELSAVQKPLSGLTISTFFPLNLPLYSLILFAVIPSIYTKNVFVRPPEVVGDILAQIYELLDIQELFPQISIKVAQRHVFVDLYASESDVIIFTGKYENALAIHKLCPYSLLVYNGSGVNPFIIFENADIDLAAKKAVEMRCFNSGQDCAGPDAFFVPESMKSEFIEKLKFNLKDMVVGDTKNPETTIGPTMKQSYVDELKEWMQTNKETILYGGEIDYENHLVHPTIALNSVKNYNEPTFHEFFAPFFYVLSYENNQDLSKILLSPGFTERAMYVSVFGDNPAIEKQLTFVKILKNQIVNDVERGNEEYGGYGVKANFLLYGDQRIVQPILVGRDMHLMLTD